METGMRIRYGISVIFLIVECLFLETAFAQNEKPVRIAFDQSSERIDLITGKKLPDYTLAQRESIRFFLGRLDEPDEFVCFTHDGFNKTDISSLGMMEKVQGEFAIWRLRYRSGSKNTPRIQDLAVSFIPLSADTKQPERRVFVLLNDLEFIDWNE